MHTHRWANRAYTHALKVVLEGLQRCRGYAVLILASVQAKEPSALIECLWLDILHGHSQLVNKFGLDKDGYG